MWSWLRVHPTIEDSQSAAHNPWGLVIGQLAHERYQQYAASGFIALGWRT